MKVYDIRDEQGRVVAFEVENLLLGRRGLARIAASIPGAVVTRRPRFFPGSAKKSSVSSWLMVNSSSPGNCSVITAVTGSAQSLPVGANSLQPFATYSSDAGRCLVSLTGRPGT